MDDDERVVARARDDRPTGARASWRETRPERASRAVDAEIKRTDAVSYFISQMIEGLHATSRLARSNPAIRARFVRLAISRAAKACFLSRDSPMTPSESARGQSLAPIDRSRVRVTPSRRSLARCSPFPRKFPRSDRCVDLSSIARVSRRWSARASARDARRVRNWISERRSRHDAHRGRVLAPCDEIKR